MNNFIKDQKLHFQKSSDDIEKEIIQLKNHTEGVIIQKTASITEMKEKMKQRHQKYDVTIKEIEENLESEIIEVSTYFEKRLKEEKILTKVIMSGNEEIKMEVEALNSKLQIKKIELNKAVQNEKTKQMIMNGVLKDIDSVRREVKHNFTCSTHI
jgi:hypothetical protein